MSARTLAGACLWHTVLQNGEILLARTFARARCRDQTDGFECMKAPADTTSSI